MLSDGFVAECEIVFLEVGSFTESTNLQKQMTHPFGWNIKHSDWKNKNKSETELIEDFHVTVRKSEFQGLLPPFLVYFNHGS